MSLVEVELLYSIPLCTGVRELTGARLSFKRFGGRSIQLSIKLLPPSLSAIFSDEKILLP